MICDLSWLTISTFINTIDFDIFNTENPQNGVGLLLLGLILCS